MVSSSKSMVLLLMGSLYISFRPKNSQVENEVAVSVGSDLFKVDSIGKLHILGVDTEDFEMASIHELGSWGRRWQQGGQIGTDATVRVSDVGDDLLKVNVIRTL